LSKDQRIPDQITVYNSILTIVEPERTSYHADVNNIEKWLLEQAIKLGYGDVIKKFQACNTSQYGDLTYANRSNHAADG
ncbi:MAG: hypothetical protein ACUZ77_05800, partial [Candidatus Brocadiales bacterium]